MDENNIKLEAKKIMNNFMDALSNIKVEDEFILYRNNSIREENKNPNKLNEDFKNRFLTNAPKTSGDSILANKGEWTK